MKKPTVVDAHRQIGSQMNEKKTVVDKHGQIGGKKKGKNQPL